MANIKIFALGGLGENGKNMYVVEVDEHIFILDAGMKYPEVDMYGIDGVIPNIDYLLEHKNQIEGIFISHGHEDHIGAIPYLLAHLHTRVYGTHFTISLIETMLEENNMKVQDFKLFRINASKVMKFGQVDVSFFNTTHSIPESIGICIKTNDGSIVYCTDFNFSAIKNGTYQTTYDRITDVARDNKVLCLLTESINSGGRGRITDDSLLEHNFNNILMLYKSRIIVGAYCTDLIRIQKIIDLSIHEGKKIAIIASKKERIIKVAMENNYLRIPTENLIDLSVLSKEEIEELTNVVIIVTGFRNEPYNSLVKMALGENDTITFTSKDKVVLMCPAVPGTEKHVTDSINTLYEYDCNLSIFDKDVLRSSHASPEDLKMMYAMLKPRYILPVKGEYRHTYEQAEVAKEYGFNEERIILLDDGDVAEFNNGELEDELKVVPVGDIYIDGTSIGVVDDDVIKERTTLAEEGIIFIYGIVDLRKRCLLGNINLVTRGFTHGMTEEELTASLGGVMERIVTNALTKKTWNKDDVNKGLTEELSKLVYRYTKHRPIIVPLIKEIL